MMGNRQAVEVLEEIDSQHVDESEDDLDPDIIPPSPEPELVGYSKRVLFHSLQPASLLVDHVESQPGPSNCDLSRPTDNIIDGFFFIATASKLNKSQMNCL